ncbi:MAG TPA: GNAT family N-acetyltransferase [Streptosporangiaceae bacterium]|nr:GNAT family N-acetyltransferase [Streptosporangiaceae bacterium]
MRLHEPVEVRAATEADLAAIAAIAQATGQDEDWQNVFPRYVRHVMAHGRFLVAERASVLTGYGAALRIGEGPRSVSMLTDLFVDPVVHGTGTGRAILAALWQDEPRRMTFSSLHAHALPLYTSFGLDAWWPLLYLRGEVRRLTMPAGWSVSPATAAQVASLEESWTGLDRAAEHAMWAAWPNGSGVIACLHGRPVATGTAGGAAAEYGISHLVTDPGAATGEAAADAVAAVLSWLEPADGRARICLPAPHPATRTLLAAGWRVAEFDLHMASEPGLIDPRSTAPSPALA